MMMPLRLPFWNDQYYSCNHNQSACALGFTNKKVLKSWNSSSCMATDGNAEDKTEWQHEMRSV